MRRRVTIAVAVAVLALVAAGCSDTVKTSAAAALAFATHDAGEAETLATDAATLAKTEPGVAIGKLATADRAIAAARRQTVRASGAGASAPETARVVVAEDRAAQRVEGASAVVQARAAAEPERLASVVAEMVRSSLCSKLTHAIAGEVIPEDSLPMLSEQLESRLPGMLSQGVANTFASAIIERATEEYDGAVAVADVDPKDRGSILNAVSASTECGTEVP